MAQKFKRPHNNYPRSGATLTKNAPKLQSVRYREREGGRERMLNKRLLGEQF